MSALVRPRMGREEDAFHFMTPRTFEQLPVSRQVLVPQFIRQGELIRIEVATGKYLERVKEAGKK